MFVQDGFLYLIVTRDKLTVPYSYVQYGIFCLSFFCKNILCLFVSHGISVRRLAAQIGCQKIKFLGFFSSCFGVSNLYRNNRKKHTRLETNRKNISQTKHLQMKRGLFQADMSRCSTKLLQTDTQKCSVGSCRQTRPGATKSSCMQT